MEFSQKLDEIEIILIGFGKSWDVLGRYVMKNEDNLTAFVLKVSRAETNQDFNRIANYYLKLI